jgi:endonuclease YncB( thermonuclease family)
MLDIIVGPVINVIDADTFDMQVSQVGTHNKYGYNSIERVRLDGVDKPEINTLAGKLAAVSFQKKLSGKTVRCSVKSRDVYGRVVAIVTPN